jgi:ribosomal protein L24
MSKSIRRRSARALAKKVWSVVLSNKDQKKNSLRSRISDYSNDDRRSASFSSKDSGQTDESTADHLAITEDGTGNHNNVDNDATGADENMSHPSTAQQHQSDPPSIKDEEKTQTETVHVDGDLPIEDVPKTKSEEMNDDESCARIDQQLCVEEFNEDNAFVEGAEVQIIKGTHKGTCGIISRLTSKCAFISIAGMPKDVRKTKSNEFLKIVRQKEEHNSGTPEIAFLEGNLVRIKRGTHKDCHGVISRTTEKCFLPKDVRKTKSADFLEVLNSCVPQESQQIEQVSIAESNEVSAFAVGMRVRVMKGKYLGKCGVISRVTSKCAFVSIEGMTKDIRKTKSKQFLHVIDPMD